MAKPSLPQGTRDFGSDTVRKRNYIFDTIRNVFELYGFQPLETPAMENLETLMGKYGEEGDKLIYRVLNNREDLADAIDYIRENPEFLQEHFAEISGLIDPSSARLKVKEGRYKITIQKNQAEEFKRKLTQYIKKLAKRALKYDLTIPFARYVAMNHAKLTFPFKRYQIQPVWRADRPQRGRYREFYQCDADVVGSSSLLNEVELVNIYLTVFEKLRIDCTIRINNRKVLTGMTELVGRPISTKVFASIIDKLDKVELEKVKKEFFEYGFTENEWTKIVEFLSMANKKPSFQYYVDLFLNSKIGREGLDEVNFIISHLSDNQKNKIVFDSTLARGLDYYTGCIFEAKANYVKIGSIGGGGRYDDLTGLFGVPNIPGVGISFGVDRIYDVMEELNLFPANVHIATQVLFFNLGDKESHAAFKLMQELRNKGIRCELYHEQTKFDKQFKYAEKKNIPYAIIIGSKELEEKNCVVKNLNTGEQQNISINQLVSFQFV
jgi:histidyl-tRNA synthetase